jgi:hypothetical protein
MDTGFSHYQEVKRLRTFSDLNTGVAPSTKEVLKKEEV